MRCNINDCWLIKPTVINAATNTSKKYVFKNTRNSLRSLNIFVAYCKMHWLTVLIRFFGCTDWSGRSVFAYASKKSFAWFSRNARLSEIPQVKSRVSPQDQDTPSHLKSFRSKKHWTQFSWILQNFSDLCLVMLELLVIKLRLSYKPSMTCNWRLRCFKCSIYKLILNSS